MKDLKARCFVFDAHGTRFHLYAVLCDDVGVVLSLPEFQWSYSMSCHAAPSADYLRSQGACKKNRVDCQSLAQWLANNWTSVVQS